MSFPGLQQHWYSRRQLFSMHVPDEVLPWLFESSSLTARLIRMCPNQFRVEVISQLVSRPTLDEHRILNMRHGRSGLVRQVRLYCGKTAVVYARTVIPVSTIQGAQRCYANLGNRPLGAMLFADRTMQRDEVTVSKVQPGDALYAATGEKKGSIWGRRSIFRVGGKPLLVSEYYLPGLFQVLGFRL
jgi:chorismate--pyruvate lyase